MNKIENIYKIINNSNKSKPKFNMITKGPSRKQVIISMSIDNKTKFIETFSTHITNINKVLKNIKSDIMVDFIQMNQAGVIIITNKVAFSLDLQTIEKYVKNTNLIDMENVDIPHLL